MHGVYAGASLGISSKGGRGRLVVPDEMREVPHIQHALHCVRLAGT